MLAADSKAVVLQYAGVMAERRFDELYKYMPEKVHFNDVEISRDRFVTQFSEQLAGFPDWTFEPLHIVTEGEFVVAHLRSTGTHKGRFMGIEPTGKSIAVTEFSMYRVVDEKIVAVWVLFDALSLTQQLA
ncbi:ester cyclase [Paractinoplanes toevensis]|uniref:Ester cyclase n=1 Tax=Paractinoplanes toevensis TaxID=571911 RepID=A0A919W3Q3_9ACTN|nr:ester cyclase [Actinoplanes toevensis]GIM93034.1 hypothetical protein Ato02nite_048270 [Actinoplanes toevensis]